MSNLLKQAYKNSGRHRAPAKNVDLLLKEALDLHGAGQFSEAAQIYGQVLDVDPENFDALHLLSLAAHQTGDGPGALAMIDRAIAINPNVADAHSNRSSILMDLDRFKDAYESCQRAVELNPDHPDALYNGGNALAKLKKHADAAAWYRESLKRRPGFVACLSNLGSELIDLNRFDEARQVIEQALYLDPGHAKALLNSGVLSLRSGDRESARNSFTKAMEADPGYALALANIANLDFECGRIAEAMRLSESALSIKSDLGSGHNSLGNCHRASGHPQSAVKSFRDAVRYAPDSAEIHSNLLLAMLADSASSLDDILNESLKYSVAHAPLSKHAGRTNRPLKRIGLVSGDLRTHPVGFFVEKLLRGLRGNEVFAYGGPVGEDKQAKKLKGLVTAWNEISHLADEEAASLIRTHEIDVLVDLSGHTSGGRLGVFALRPAPVQVTWLGYSGTTGLSQFDALIGDSVVTPRNDEDFYSEPIVRLAHGFAPLLELEDSPDIRETPAIQNGFVTFGSFNSTTKFNDEVIAAWSQVLNQVPGSKMILKNLYFADTQVRDRVAGAFASNGIGLEKLAFRGQSSRAAHFEAFEDVDIHLDTFPYSGATTTADCLWMGVPVVTLSGDRYAGRMSESFLRATGLDGLVAGSIGEFVQISKNLASDVDSLNQLRLSTRDRVRTSKLFDENLFADDFMSVLNSVWSQSEVVAA